MRRYFGPVRIQAEGGGEDTPLQTEDLSEAEAKVQADLERIIAEGTAEIDAKPIDIHGGNVQPDPSPSPSPSPSPVPVPVPSGSKDEKKEGGKIGGKFVQNVKDYKYYYMGGGALLLGLIGYLTYKRFGTD